MKIAVLALVLAGCFVSSPERRPPPRREAQELKREHKAEE
jgi:hypothetical protein